ncbi:MAG: hypothetical protein Q4C67_03355 [Deinococcus sp.]|nr:hypothetical protein [Deinococcus sp.]
MPPWPTSTGSPAPQISPPHVAAIGTLLLMSVCAPQALLPLLAREFGVSTAQVGTVIGSTTLPLRWPRRQRACWLTRWASGGCCWELWRCWRP